MESAFFSQPQLLNAVWNLTSMESAKNVPQDLSLTPLINNVLTSSFPDVSKEASTVVSTVPLISDLSMAPVFQELMAVLNTLSLASNSFVQNVNKTLILQEVSALHHGETILQDNVPYHLK